jgi:hypothetical protein
MGGAQCSDVPPHHPWPPPHRHHHHLVQSTTTTPVIHVSPTVGHQLGKEPITTVRVMTSSCAALFQVTKSPSIGRHGTDMVAHTRTPTLLDRLTCNCYHTAAWWMQAWQPGEDAEILGLGEKAKSTSLGLATSGAVACECEAELYFTSTLFTYPHHAPNTFPLSPFPSATSFPNEDALTHREIRGMVVR